MAMTVTKERLHALIEDLPESAWPAAERLLIELSDPFLRLLATAPLDDEPETPEEAAAVAEAWESVRRGAVLSHEEVRRQLLDES